ncbi:recombinase family protein [Mycobacterium adipatum]|uniref:recombinase family protein n=1 Tax=Mycobacterium adipatum TaxID=1682113 RepID=UPI0034E0877D
MNAKGSRTKAIGYIRVSTKAQGENGYGLESQRERVQKYCEENDLELVALIPDVMSGKKTDKLYGRIAAVTAIQAGVANVLVINALDRSSRSMADGAKLVADAKAEGWRIVGLDGTDSETVSQLTAHARLLVAEEERDLISRRTKQGLIKARQNGAGLGTPSEIPAETIQRIVDLRMRDRLPARQIADRLTAEGIPTPTQRGVRRSTKWSYSTVRGVLAREGIE